MGNKRVLTLVEKIVSVMLTLTLLQGLIYLFLLRLNNQKKLNQLFLLKTNKLIMMSTEKSILNLFKLDGQVALIVGGNRGLGLAM